MIKALLEKLACKHKWEVHFTTTVYGDGFGNDTDYPTKHKQTLICEKCGKIKRINL